MVVATQRREGGEDALLLRLGPFKLRLKVAPSCRRTRRWGGHRPRSPRLPPSAAERLRARDARRRASPGRGRPEIEPPRRCRDRMRASGSTRGWPTGRREAPPSRLSRRKPRACSVASHAAESSTLSSSMRLTRASTPSGRLDDRRPERHLARKATRTPVVRREPQAERVATVQVERLVERGHTTTSPRTASTARAYSSDTRACR